MGWGKFHYPGIGRTGAFIAIDQLLHAAEAAGRVDVFQCIYNMRKQRKNMVQTEEQYVFVYDVLLEALLCDVTEVPAQQVHRRIRKLQVVNPRTRITGYQKELQALNKLSEVFQVRPHKEALKPTNRSKNRDPYILPADHFRPALMSLTNDDGSPGYINAVFADGFTKKDSFIITQFPLKDTVTDFWALVYDYNCTSIIMMNRHEDLDERMHHAQHIKMLQLDDWPVTDPLPMSRDTVIHMLRDTEDWQRRNNGRVTLVMCQDGASRSGLFCAASQIREQIRMEGKVDVLQAVKTLRNSRPELIRDMVSGVSCCVSKDDSSFYLMKIVLCVSNDDSSFYPMKIMLCVSKDDSSFYIMKIVLCVYDSSFYPMKIVLCVSNDSSFYIMKIVLCVSNDDSSFYPMKIMLCISKDDSSFYPMKIMLCISKDDSSFYPMKIMLCISNDSSFYPMKIMLCVSKDDSSFYPMKIVLCVSKDDNSFYPMKIVKCLSFRTRH
ncbi:UNVERIFIED_CONTAM: hypothetical protein FKN15_071725 [Acipenser sinensis]